MRGISSRARITATSFANNYKRGDLKCDPLAFMKQWFDLLLYMANWPARRLMIRLGRRLVDETVISCRATIRMREPLPVSSRREGVARP